MRRARVAFFAVWLMAGSLAGRPASAQDKPDLAAAAEAYDAGALAHRQRDYARAAALFAHADDLAPDPASRLAALKSALLADDPVLGMALVDRATRAGALDGPLGDAVRAAQEKFAARVGRIRIACAGCSASIDGGAAAVGREVLVARGEHAVELTAAGRVERQVVRVDGADAIEVSPTPEAAAAPLGPSPARSTGPADAPPPPATARARSATGARPSGISPAWFFVGAGVTVLAGGLTIASGVDVRNREQEFYRAPTDEKAADGQAAETRTYVLGAITGAAGIATAAIAIFAVRWQTTRVRIGATPSGVSTAVYAAF